VLDGFPARRQQAQARHDDVGTTAQRAEHSGGLSLVPRLSENRSLDDDGGVHPEDRALSRLTDHGPRLADRMCPHQLRRLEAGVVALLVVRGDDVEGKPELLEDDSALRGGRRQQDRRGHGLRAIQISSAGHRRAHAAGTKS
jgi:hypothetical protein